MRTSPTKRHLQAALALTLLACSGLTGCSDSQEQGATNAGTSKARRRQHAHQDTNRNSQGYWCIYLTGAPTATASPTITMTPELEASKETGL